MMIMLWLAVIYDMLDVLSDSVENQKSIIILFYFYLLSNRRFHAHQNGLHAFHIHLYLHEFFESILFLTPVNHGLWEILMKA